MPYPNEHSCRLIDPDALNIVGSGERDHNGKKYRVIFGRRKSGDGTQEQAYRYDKDAWSADAARSHCADHNGSFEAATGEVKEGLKNSLKNSKFPFLIFENIVLQEAKLPNGNYRISGSAIHPCKTFHPNEWVKVRQYIEPYLERAAPSLAGKHIVIDHNRSLPSENSLKFSRWNKEASSVDFEGEITEDVYKMFQNGTLKRKVSVGVDWLKPGGGIVVGQEGEIIPYAFDFNELSFMSQAMNPGDPETNLQIWEGVLKEAIAEPQDFILYPIRDLSVFMLGHFRVEWVDRENGVQALFGRLIEKPESYQPFALLFMKTSGWTEQSIDTWLVAKPQFSRSALAPPPTGVEQAVESPITDLTDLENFITNQ